MVNWDNVWTGIECQAGLVLGSTAVFMTHNPLTLGITGMSCLPEAQAAAPVVVNPIPNQIANIGHIFDYTIPANTFNDTDGDLLSYTITLVDNISVPEWIELSDIVIVPPVKIGTMIHLDQHGGNHFRKLCICDRYD